jgi:hypothetical protein
MRTAVGPKCTPARRCVAGANPPLDVLAQQITLEPYCFVLEVEPLG